MGDAGHIPRWALEHAPVFGRFSRKSVHRGGDRRPHAKIPAQARGGSVEIDWAATGTDAFGDQLTPSEEAFMRHDPFPRGTTCQISRRGAIGKIGAAAGMAVFAPSLAAEQAPATPGPTPNAARGVPPSVISSPPRD